MRSIISIAALFTAALTAPTLHNCTSVGSQGFFPFAFTASNDVTGAQAGAGLAFDGHNRNFRYLGFAGTGLDTNGVLKATRLNSLNFFQYDNYACTVYDPNNSTNQEVGRFDKTLGWGDLLIYGGRETDITDFIIKCDILVIWYPEGYS